LNKFKIHERVWFISTYQNPSESNLYEGIIVWKVPKIRYNDTNIYHCKRLDDNDFVYEVASKYMYKYKNKQEAIDAFKTFIQKALKENEKKQKMLIKSIERLKRL
jgi:hypothetical protein